MREFAIEDPVHDWLWGEVATIVEVYTLSREGYELEFVGEGGITMALFSLRPEDIELST